MREGVGPEMLKRMTIVAMLMLLLAAASGPLGRECAASEEEEAEAEAGLRVNPHDSDEQMCSVCHTQEPPLLSRDPVTTCVRCHPGNIGNHPVTRHPMGLMTKIRIPASLPLTEDGEMVCYTCHEPHGKARHPRLLRVEYLKLCASCHRGY